MYTVRRVLGESKFPPLLHTRQVEEMMQEADVPSSADSRKASKGKARMPQPSAKPSHGKKPRSSDQHTKAASHHRRDEEEEDEDMHVDEDEEEQQETHPQRPISSAHRSLAAAEKGRHATAPLRPAQPIVPTPGLTGLIGPPPSSAPSKPRRPAPPPTHSVAVKSQRITRTSLFAGMHFLITGISPATKPAKKFLEGRIRNAGGTLIEAVVGLEPMGSSAPGRAEAFFSQDFEEGEGDGKTLNVPQSQLNGAQPKEIVVIATPAAYRRIKVGRQRHPLQPRSPAHQYIADVFVSPVCSTCGASRVAARWCTRTGWRSASPRTACSPTKTFSCPRASPCCTSDSSSRTCPSPTSSQVTHRAIHSFTGAMRLVRECPLLTASNVCRWCMFRLLCGAGVSPRRGR